MYKVKSYKPVLNVSLNRTPLTCFPLAALLLLLPSIQSSLFCLTALLLKDGFFLIVPPSGESQLNPCSRLMLMLLCWDLSLRLPVLLDLWLFKVPLRLLGVVGKPHSALEIKRFVIIDTFYLVGTILWNFYFWFVFSEWKIHTFKSTL